MGKSGGTATGGAITFRPKLCLSCRKPGHKMANCPQSKGKKMESICWRCGAGDHSVVNCPKPDEDGATPFATCFICQEKGHVASKCAMNGNGVYPRGGSCFHCQSINHYAKDCPMKEQRLAQKRENRKDKRHRKSSDRPDAGPDTSGDEGVTASAPSDACEAVAEVAIAKPEGSNISSERNSPQHPGTDGSSDGEERKQTRSTSVSEGVVAAVEVNASSADRERSKSSANLSAEKRRRKATKVAASTDCSANQADSAKSAADTHAARAPTKSSHSKSKSKPKA